MCSLLRTAILVGSRLPFRAVSRYHMINIRPTTYTQEDIETLLFDGDV